MTKKIKKALGTAAATAAVTALGLVAPQTSVAETAAISHVKLSSKANAATRAIAAADPQAAKAAATLCGAGYELYNAERLPDARRFATLFTYDNGGTGPRNWECAVFDNNLGISQYMKLKMCENQASNPRCSVDANYYTQYAGPVRMNNCPTVTAIMADTPSSTAYINAVRGFCD